MGFAYNHITLPKSISFLESAGSASVAFQLLSPGSREYFSQAILQSAAATNPWGMVTRKEGQLRALRLAENSNCPHYGVSYSMPCFANKSITFIKAVLYVLMYCRIHIFH